MTVRSPFHPAMDKKSKFLMRLLAATAAGLLRAQQVPPPEATVNPLAASATAAADGRKLFSTTCQICHGADGQGDRDRGGATLNRPGLKHGDGDADIFRVIRGGVPGSLMPSFSFLSERQAWELVAYIHSLQGPTQGAAAPPVPGNAAAGEALFFGRAGCYACHEVNERGGVTGPDLSNAGRLGEEALRQEILSPNNPPQAAAGARGEGPGGRSHPPVTVVARTADGMEIRGVRRNEDAYSLQMVDASGQLHLLDKRRLASVGVENRSLMPDDLGKRLSGDEITDLVAYLCAQKERDLGKTILQPLAGGVTYDRLVNSGNEPQNWLTYWGDYRGTHYSTLSQVNAGNVRRLSPAWAFPDWGWRVPFLLSAILLGGIDLDPAASWTNRRCSQR